MLSLFSCAQLFATPWTAAHQAPLSMGFFQARILELVAIFFSRGSSPLRDWTQVSCISCTAGNSWRWANGENQRKHAYNWITLPHNRNQHNIISQLYLNQKKTKDPQAQIYVHNDSKMLFVFFTILTKTRMIQKQGAGRVKLGIPEYMSREWPCILTRKKKHFYFKNVLYEVVRSINFIRLQPLSVYIYIYTRIYIYIYTHIYIHTYI